MEVRGKIITKEKQKIHSNQRPLADLIRPKNFADVVGQEHLLDSNGIISKLLAGGHVPSMILWGPPGCGKTTIAKIIARESKACFKILSAVTTSVTELKKHFSEAADLNKMGQKTIILIDEIHRFNRAQQDVLLPVIEDGTIILIGATTENPSFELNAALLSRCRVLVLKALDNDALEKIVKKAVQEYGKKLPLKQDALAVLYQMADGDGRYLLNMCEQLFIGAGDKPLSAKELSVFIQKRAPLYDKHQDAHYNLISALHKSLRGSDVDASLYWFARMLQGGENPLYIARRLVRFAVEDIGLADPNAVQQALAAKDAYDFLGSPEGELAIGQAVIYLATAPKSNSAYMAFKGAIRSARQHGSLIPPAHILNAPTNLMKQIGYGKNYEYDHDSKDGFSGQNYFPEDMVRQQYYQPVERGFEREIKKRLAYWDKLRNKRANNEIKG